MRLRLSQALTVAFFLPALAVAQNAAIYFPVTYSADGRTIFATNTLSSTMSQPPAPATHNYSISVSLKDPQGHVNTGSNSQSAAAGSPITLQASVSISSLLIGTYYESIDDTAFCTFINALFLSAILNNPVIEPPVINAGGVVDNTTWLNTFTVGDSGYFSIWGISLEAEGTDLTPQITTDDSNISITPPVSGNDQNVLIAYHMGNGTKAGSHNLYVTTTAGKSNAGSFTVYDATPVITRVTPNTFVAGTTTPNVSITGMHFGTVPTVIIQGAGASTFTVTSGSDGQIYGTMFIDPNAPTPAASLEVQSNGYGSGFQPQVHQSPDSLPAPLIIAMRTNLRTNIVNPPVASDGDAIIATVPFTLQVQAFYTATGQVATTISGPVTLTFESGPPGENRPASVNLSAGTGTATVTLTAVNGTSQTRSYTANSSAGVVTNAVNVWFQVKCTDEGLVGGNTGCQHLIQPNDHFVALPATGLCASGVNVRYSGTSASTSKTLVEDVGPWFPHSTATPANPCVGPNDNYWNNSGVPRVVTNPCIGNPVSSNGSGIDLADGTFHDLGNPLSVIWRFGY